MVRRAAVFPAASSVGVARSPRVGVPSIPRGVSGGWWVCAGVIRKVYDSCLGGACWGVRPRESCGVRWGWGRAGPSVVVCPSWVWVVAPAVVPSFSVPRSPLLPLPGPWVVSCPHVVSLGALSFWAPATHLGRLVAPLPECPLLSLALPLPLPFPFPVWWWWDGGGGADGPGLEVGGLEPLAEGLAGVGGAEALDRIAEEGLPCRLRHDGFRGGPVGVRAGAGAHLLEAVHHVHPFSPSRSPDPLHPAAELLQSGGRPPNEVGGGPGGVGLGWVGSRPRLVAYPRSAPPSLRDPTGRPYPGVRSQGLPDC